MPVSTLGNGAKFLPTTLDRDLCHLAHPQISFLSTFTRLFVFSNYNKRDTREFSSFALLHRITDESKSENLNLSLFYPLFHPSLPNLPYPVPRLSSRGTSLER